MDWKGPSGFNKRHFKRQPGRFTLRYRLAGHEDQAPPQIATTMDLSSNGLGFCSSQAIPVDTKIIGELNLPQAAKPISITGTVRRIEKDPDKDIYICGIFFDSIDPQDRSLLKRYVQTSDVSNILRAAAKKNASDIHLIAHQPPIFRIQGELEIQDAYPIAPDDLREMVNTIISAKQRELFEKSMELDFSYFSMDGIRFRGNVHSEKGYVEASFRIIPREVKTLLELGLPPVVGDLAKRKKGLILITGPSGHGKSTTMTTMIDLINQQRKCMIVSIEDPIEFLHESKMSVIKQREVGQDTLSFNDALKHVLRQDVDVILVGEMRDTESISMVMSAAETGHLVLSTLHTADAAECINRIMDAYPEEQQSQVRSQLAGCVEGIISQLLVPRSDGTGRILASEVLIATPAIRNLIRTGQVGQLHTYMESGGSSGMKTMDSSLKDLVRKGLISEDTALSYARDFKKILGSLP